MIWLLVLIMSGNTVNWLSLAEGANLGLVAFGSFILGGLVFVVGPVKGPTDEELERRALMLAGQGR